MDIIKSDSFDILISSVIKLAVTMDSSKDGRAIYSNDQYKMQYVTSSTEWDTPHWQVNDAYSIILPDSLILPDIFMICRSGILFCEAGDC